MTRRQAVFAGAGVLARKAAPPLAVAPFQADVTPAAGEPLIWTMPAREVLDPLLAKGCVLESGRERYVLCTLDWCGIANRTYDIFRQAIAGAVRTAPERVLVHTVHQHTAPYVDSTAYDLLREMGKPVRQFSGESLERLARRVAEAARAAVKRLELVDRIGTGRAAVAAVASARRLHADGKLVTRFSTGAKDPAMAALPEGPIDRSVRTITLARGERPLVRWHYYATHPQTFCCDGRITADLAGTARQRMETAEGVPQIYFTGCGGDVTVGRYNDGSDGSRAALETRLLAGLRASAAATAWHPVGAVGWQAVPLVLPARVGTVQQREAELAAMREGMMPDLRYRAAQRIVFGLRRTPLAATLLAIGPVRVLHLPGEPMLEFQRFALAQGKGFVTVAGYGDISPGYICTDEAYREGGYEPSASHTAPGAEAVVKAAIGRLLG